MSLVIGDLPFVIDSSRFQVVKWSMRNDKWQMANSGCSAHPTRLALLQCAETCLGTYEIEYLDLELDLDFDMPAAEAGDLLSRTIAEGKLGQYHRVHVFVQVQVRVDLQAAGGCGNLESRISRRRDLQAQMRREAPAVNELPDTVAAFRS